MYTRLTATGRHELRVACTCAATSARAWAVSATRPSIPAVARPALRCVTCRMLISVFDQDRSMRFLQVPGPSQVPVPHRLEDPAPQPPYPLLMHPPVHLLPGVSVEHTRRVLRSVHRGVQHALRFRHPRPLRRQRLTCPRQHPIRGSRHHSPVSGRLSDHHPGEGPGQRSSVSRRLSTTGIRFLGTLSRREFRPDYSRPTTTGHTYLRTRCGPRRGFTTFHTRETQTGPGALFTPGDDGVRWPSSCPWPPPAASQRPIP